MQRETKADGQFSCFLTINIETSSIVLIFRIEWSHMVNGNYPHLKIRFQFWQSKSPFLFVKNKHSHSPVSNHVVGTVFFNIETSIIIVTDIIVLSVRHSNNLLNQIRKLFISNYLLIGNVCLVEISVPSFSSILNCSGP